MVGIFGNGSCFICWWKGICSGEGAWEGDGLDSHALVIREPSQIHLDPHFN